MGKLVVGNDLISINSAVKRVRKNIQKLTEKKEQAERLGDAAAKICVFYETRISAQQALLIWLRKAA